MKVAHVVCAFPPLSGGMGNSVYQFVQVLSKIGYQATVFTPAYKHAGDFLNEGECFVGDETRENAVPDIQDKKFRIVRLKPFFKRGYAAFLPQLFWRLNKFDIIHLHYPFYGAAEIVLLRKIFSRKKFKLITHFHMDNRESGVKGFIFLVYRTIVLPALARKSDIIISSSLDYVKHSSLKKYFFKNSGKFREVRFGINLNKLAPKDLPRASGAKTVLFVGRLDRSYHSKGLDVLLRAMKIITKKTAGKVLLKVIGEGDLRGEYIKLAKNLGVGENVEFLEKIDNEKLVDYYNGCDVFTLPSSSRGEAFGIVLLEAMACAKPVVASDIPGVRSVFMDGEHGLLAKPGDAADLAEKISLILNDDNMRKKMGIGARKYAEKNYSLETAGEKLAIIYTQLLAN